MLNSCAGVDGYSWVWMTSCSGFEKDRSALCNIEPVDGAAELNCDSASEMTEIWTTLRKSCDTSFTSFMYMQRSFGELQELQ
jgi:hypothetical protein